MADVFAVSGESTDVGVAVPIMTGSFIPAIDSPGMPDGFGLVVPWGAGGSMVQLAEYGVSGKPKSDAQSVYAAVTTAPVVNYYLEGLTGPQGIPGPSGQPGSVLIGTPIPGGTGGLIDTAQPIWTGSIVFSDDSPSAGYVSWTTGVLRYKGIAYQITAGNSNKGFVYWDLADPAMFQGTDTRADAVGANRWIVARNMSGEALVILSGKLVDGGILVDTSVLEAALHDAAVTTNKIAANTVVATKMSKAMQPFMHDLKFLPGNNASENKHNAVHWVAGTIKFSDGTTQVVNTGQITGLGDGTTRYVYFSVGNNDLQNTSEYSGVATETTRLLATLIVSSDTDQEIGILFNQNLGGNWIRDLLAPKAISSDQLKDFAVAVKKTNLTMHQIY